MLTFERGFCGKNRILKKGLRMWVNMIFMIHMSITVIGQEGDGSYNYLIESASNYNKYSISISTKDPLPYAKRESFIARFRGECSEIWAGDNEHSSRKVHICNATSLQTKKGVYIDQYNNGR